MATAESAPHAAGFRRSIANAGDRLKIGHPKLDAAVEAATQFWLNVHADISEKTEQYIERDKSRAHNIVGAAVTLGLSVIMLILMAIVAGYFVSEAPSDGAFSDAIDQVESVGGTAFVLLAVALLAVPVVAIVGYFMSSGLGAFISTGGMRR